MKPNQISLVKCVSIAIGLIVPSILVFSNAIHARSISGNNPKPAPAPPRYCAPKETKNCTQRTTYNRIVIPIPQKMSA
jgi:hypothetical protein